MGRSGNLKVLTRYIIGAASIVGIYFQDIIITVFWLPDHKFLSTFDIYMYLIFTVGRYGAGPDAPVKVYGWPQFDHGMLRTNTSLCVAQDLGRVRDPPKKHTRQLSQF